MENTLKKPMTGIIPPLVTPLLDNDKLDIDGLERLIDKGGKTKRVNMWSA